jgi:phosphate uptake regulator
MDHAGGITKNVRRLSCTEYVPRELEIPRSMRRMFCHSVRMHQDAAEGLENTWEARRRIALEWAENFGSIFAHLDQNLSQFVTIG